MKGLEFERIVTLFEAYKIECNAPNATLERITKKPSRFSLRHYYNNYQHPKWRVPYAEPFEQTKTGLYPRASMDHCLKGGISEEKWREAEKRARSYIAKLSSDDNSRGRTASDQSLDQQ